MNGLLVVGGPTHIHGLASNLSRRSARDEATRAGHDVIDEAKAEPGLRTWLNELPAVDELHAAAFDTRIARARWFTGTAARSIARRLRAHGCNAAHRLMRSAAMPVAIVPNRRRHS